MPSQKPTEYLQQVIKKATMEPSQEQWLDTLFFLSRSRSADFSEVGTGKSLKSYLYLIAKVFQGKRCVVVMPPALIHQYIQEFKRIFPDLGISIANFCVPAAKRNLLKEQDEWNIACISYQLFLTCNIMFVNAGVSVAVVDEAHFLKSGRGKTFYKVENLLRGPGKELLLMTATPLKLGMVDAYGFIKLLYPRAGYHSFKDFERKHVTYSLVTGFKKIIGYREQETIKRFLSEGSVRRLSDDVLSLEDPTLIEHRVALSPAHRILYETFLLERMLEFGDRLITAENTQALRQHSMKLISVPEEYTEDKVENAPFESLLAILDSIDVQKHKVIIFCHFRVTVESLAKKLKEFNPATIYGGANNPKQVVKLTNDPSCRVGVVNYSSGGAGLNFQFASHIIMYEPIGVPADMVQAIGRCRRRGQEKVVKVWLFAVERTPFIRLINSALERDIHIMDMMKDRKSILQALYLPQENV